MSACRVCGRALDDMGTCVCATRRAAPPPPAPWSWLTEEESDALRTALHALRKLPLRAFGALERDEILDQLDAAAALANVVEELLAELPRRRLRADPAKEDVALFLGGSRAARGDDAS